MRKYLMITAQMLSSGGEKLASVLIRISFFIVIVYIFSNLWKSTELTHTGFTWEMMVWYLCTTELVLLSLPLVQFEIESDIRSGDIVYILSKPVHYIWLKAAESFGALLLRFIILTPVSLALATFLCKGWTPLLSNIFLGLAAAFLAATALLFFHIAIGLMAFQIEDCSPLFWLWQRSSFLLGGLILPLTFYPKIVQVIANATPFPALIGGPAKILIGVTTSNPIALFLLIVLWLFCGILIGHILFRSLFRTIRVNGG